MITYRLNLESTFAEKYVDGVATGEWHNIETNAAYLEWVKAGNTPEPPEL